MCSSAPHSKESLDEDLQIILATLAILSLEIEKLAPASSRVLEDACVKVAEARELLSPSAVQRDDPRQLSFSLLETSR